MKETWFPGKLATLDDAECRELLARQEIGRVAWCDALGPVIYPVNYVVDEHGDIRIRIEPRSALAHQVEMGALTFQIDDYDSFSQSGWSVLVRGHGRYVNPPSAEAAPQPEPWVAGDRTFNVRITPQIITGRRIIPR